MMISCAARHICLILSVIIALPSGFGQTAPPAGAARAEAGGAPLSIFVLEGKNVVNSISLLRSVTPVVEVRDQNDFPVEGATVVFTLPATGPGGTFAAGGNTFTTRSDARGQATAPAFTPRGAGKFDIVVAANAGNRHGETVVTQTNSTGSYAGAPIPPRPWYKKKLVWVVVGGAAAAVVVVVALRSSSSNSSTVVITPGPPVFQ